VAQRLREGRHGEPHQVLGPHPYTLDDTAGVLVRVLQPDAADALVLREGVATPCAPRATASSPSFLPGASLPMRYTFRFIAPDGHSWERGDPYRFAPSVGEMDLYLFREARTAGSGRCSVPTAHARRRRRRRLRRVAPNADRVSVIGDWCNWDGRQFRCGGSATRGSGSCSSGVRRTRCTSSSCARREVTSA